MLHSLLETLNGESVTETLVEPVVRVANTKCNTQRQNALKKFLLISLLVFFLFLKKTNPSVQQFSIPFLSPISKQ